MANIVMAPWVVLAELPVLNSVTSTEADHGICSDVDFGLDELPPTPPSAMVTL